MNNSMHQWPDPVLPDTDDNYKPIDVIDFKRTDMLTEFSQQICKQVQFPCNTVFMHAIGVIASAMTKSFSYEYYGATAPVNLYVITSQPPSSGKSGVNKFLSDPVRIAYADYNKNQKMKRARLESKIKDLKKLLKDSSNDNEIDALSNDLAAAMEDLDETPVYKYAVSNTTPEALEKICFEQRGVWNVISDEAGSINTLIGGAYSDRIVNADIVLQSWDGDWMSSARVSRDAGEGFVKGSIAVIAQDETIDTILEAGTRGNGISERFLLYREKNMLGDRDHNSFTPVEGSLKAKYAQLINMLVNADDTLFKFSNESMNIIRQRKADIEPHLKDGEKYSNNMLRGAIGKMDKQVMKISCILHVIETWGRSTPTTIEAATVEWAIQIHTNLMEMYIHAADSQGFIGDKSEINEMVKQFRKYLEKKKAQVTAVELRDAVKHRPVFKGRPKLTTYLKDQVIPMCQELHLCSLVDNTVYINPKLV